jgi:hypothetical protein
MTKKQGVINDSQLSIKNFPSNYVAKVKEYCQQQDITYREYFISLIDNFEISNIVYSDDEKALIDKASNLSTVPMDEIKKQVILRAARNIINNNGYLRTQNIPDINSRTSSAAAFERISNIVEVMISHNDTAEEWYNKKYINQRSIDLYAKKLKEQSSDNLVASKVIINRYLDANKEKLKEHHALHDLSINHNRNAYHHLQTIKNKTSEEV